MTNFNHVCDNPSPPPLFHPPKSIAIELKGERPTGGREGRGKGGGREPAKTQPPTPRTPLSNQKDLLMANLYSGHTSI